MFARRWIDLRPHLRDLALISVRSNSCGRVGDGLEAERRSGGPGLPAAPTIFSDLACQMVDDRPSASPAGSTDALHRAGHQLRHAGFRHGRHVREFRQTRGLLVDAERAQLAVLDVRARRCGSEVKAIGVWPPMVDVDGRARRR